MALLVVECLFVPFICSCENGGADEDMGTYAYYLVDNATRLVATPYSLHSEDTPGELEEYKKLAEKAPAKTSYEPLVPSGDIFEVDVIQDGVLYINFTESYFSISNDRRALMRGGLVKMFCQIPGVESVAFCVDGKPVALNDKGNVIQQFSPADFVENASTDIHAYEKTSLELYYTDAEGKKLVRHKRSIYHNTNVNLVDEIIEQLKKGSPSEGIYPTLPEKLSLIDASAEGSDCYVIFSDAFIRDALSVDPSVIIYSVVDSITSSTGYKNIMISINGYSGTKFKETVDLRNFFKFDLLEPEKNNK